MRLTASRSVDPPTIRVALEFDPDDLRAVFERENPDELLFFALFSGAFHRKSTSEQLTLLARAAMLADEAVSLNLTAGMPEPK